MNVVRSETACSSLTDLDRLLYIRDVCPTPEACTPVIIVTATSTTKMARNQSCGLLACIITLLRIGPEPVSPLLRPAKLQVASASTDRLAQSSSILSL